MVQALARLVGDLVRTLLRSSSRRGARTGGAAAPSRSPAPSRTPRRPSRPTASGMPREARDAYPGDTTDIPDLRYAPFPDDEADPGEIVWAWVPFEEDHTRGKDRPVLVIGRREGLLLALMLTSKDHDRDAADEARYGRHWTDIGTGDWDRQGRPSEVRVDRVLQLHPSAVRREGATLDRARFDLVAAAVRHHHLAR